MKKLLGWAAVAALVIWAIQNPAHAAADARQLAHDISTFVSGL